MPRRFFTLDVFTGEPLAGNPLAAVLDAEGLDDARMQAIAREFNLSETVFVHPPRATATAPPCASSPRAGNCLSRATRRSARQSSSLCSIGPMGRIP
jgi:hypothetical protein